MSQSFRSFCYGTPAQLHRMAVVGIVTIEDLFIHIADDVMGYACEFPETGGVYKRHVVSFFNHRFRGVHMDFQKLIRERVVRVGGEYPRQWMVLNDKSVDKRRKSHALPPVCPSTAEPVPKTLLKIHELVHVTETPVVIRHNAVNGPKSPASVAAHHLEGGDAPEELCCPITLQRFIDPVTTVNGQTYDRASILEWFSKPGPTTDPLTGQHLWSTVLYDDAIMRAKCGLF